MKATNSKTIAHWLEAIDNSTLCLPRFQREVVWKKKEAVKLLESIILESDMPIGIFLVLETDSEHPVFEPRNINGAPAETGNCRELLLDGQQRLTALWNALSNPRDNNGDDNGDDCNYYAEFDLESEEIKKVVAPRKGTTAEENRVQNPKKQFSKKWLPLWTLSPFVDMTEVDKWINSASNKDNDRGAVKRIITEKRKIFKKRGGKVIPYFKLPSSVDRNKAVEIYTTINTNAVKLSDHYLAVAEMEKKTGHSLYDIAEKLKNDVPKIEDLEDDTLVELILKIFCLINNKTPSGGNYKNLPFDNLVSSKVKIIAGIKWTVGKLAKTKIWRGRQLPTVVPLRVLPALHVEFPDIDSKPNDVQEAINRYLWHSFLTDHYSNQANDRLKQDFDLIKDCIKNEKRPDPPIFSCTSPSNKEIKEAGWPRRNAKSILARGLLLVCCSKGAKTLLDGRDLDENAFSKREQHHIFPKSKIDKNKGDRVMNCLLIPKEENQKFSNEWPGDYIQNLFDDSGDPLLADILQRLKTHGIGPQAAKSLIEVTKNKIASENVSADLAFDNFIDKRAKSVRNDVKKLLRNGEL